jgi:3-hydroxybutyryl-CoA dehydrogenase
MADLPKSHEIQRIGVVGAGQMGAGIAQVASTAGFAVKLADASLDLAQKGRAKIEAILRKQVDKGKMTAETKDAIVGKIAPISGTNDFGDCDLVIEAATERLELKLEIFKRCDEVMPPRGYLASNTSSISLTRLAASVKRQERVIGMHFFNPPPLMKLVEIVRAMQTSDQTYEAIKAAAEKMGKTVITSKDSPGFLVNRMLMPMIGEACFALQEGLGTPEDIDTGAKLGLNHPMGPLELADLIGLDTCLSILDVLHKDLGDDKYRAPTLLRNLVAAGWLGRKAGRGFYVYDAPDNKAASKTGAKTGGTP